MNKKQKISELKRQQKFWQEAKVYANAQEKHATNCLEVVTEELEKLGKSNSSYKDRISPEIRVNAINRILKKPLGKVASNQI